MYKSIGVNMDKEYKNLRKKSRYYVPPSHYKENFSNVKNNYHCCCNDDNHYKTDDYSFYDTMEDMEDCMESKNPNCKIRSCLLDKEIEVNKTIIMASCIGVIAGVIGVSCAIKKKNKPQNKMLKSAPYLMKIAKNFI